MENKFSVNQGSSPSSSVANKKYNFSYSKKAPTTEVPIPTGNFINNNYDIKVREGNVMITNWIYAERNLTWKIP